jgi:hypothetical protein|nr:MAG TPA: hypothetical protein [Caudoviricetes sp.]
MEKIYIGLDGLQWYDGWIKDYISKQIKENEKQVVINEDSYLQFPTIGSPECLYVDTTANKIYRWDDANLKYFTVGSDYNEIEIIDGTGK